MSQGSVVDAFYLVEYRWQGDENWTESGYKFGSLDAAMNYEFVPGPQINYRIIRATREIMTETPIRFVWEEEKGGDAQCSNTQFL